MTVIERAEKIAAELDQLYVPDGATRFERVAMVRLVEHILILNDRHQPQGAVEALQAIYDRHHMNGDGSAGQVSGDALRALGIDPDGDTA